MAFVLFARSSSSADITATPVQSFQFLEIGKWYAFYHAGSQHPQGGKLVERLDGNWAKLDEGRSTEDSIWWINLNEVTAIRVSSPPRPLPVQRLDAFPGAGQSFRLENNAPHEGDRVMVGRGLNGDAGILGRIEF